MCRKAGKRHDCGDFYGCCLSNSLKIGFTMKRGAKIRLVVLLGVTALASQNAKAGSAVSTDGHGHLVYSYGHPRAVEEQTVLDFGRVRYGPNVRILAASDVPGYGAIAIARKGTGSVAGVALGKRSANEADALALDHCLKAGGTHPTIRWRFRG
jgi:hypothetical protein